MSLVQIIHLDLKSHNILLGRGGVAKIADVGLAKIMSTSATRASAAGTFDWAAPGAHACILLSLCFCSSLHFECIVHHQLCQVYQTFSAMLCLKLRHLKQGPFARAGSCLMLGFVRAHGCRADIDLHC